MRFLAALVATFFLLCGFVVVAPALANPSASASAEGGKLTEVKGHVFKRGFADADREVWSDPVPAQLGDIVMDGMQVGTGDHSWTQCTWKHVTARAWENSVYMVSPKQKLVYLVGGELLFNLDKHRPDKTPYSVWTKYLHATVRGTTILVQTTPEGSRLSVLEGTVDVTNRLDRSTITLTPGVVYEVKAKNDPASKTEKISDASGITDGSFVGDRVYAAEQLGLKGTLDAFAGKVDLTSAPLIDLGIANLDPVVLFDSLTSTTIATLTSVQQILVHPLLSSAFETPLAALPLIKAEMPLLEHDLIRHQGAGVSEIFKGVTIQQVPILSAYSIGSDTLSRVKGREVAFQHWSPSGVVSWSRNNGAGQLPVIGQAADKLPGKITDSVVSKGALTSILNRGTIVPIFDLRANLVTNVTRQTGVASSAAMQGGRGGGVVGGTLNGVNQTVGGLGGATTGALGGILGGGGLGGLLK
jgi:hypothetical protein